MLGLIIAGITSLVLLIDGAAIGSTALAHSIQTAHFIDNWSTTADENWKIQRETDVKLQIQVSILDFGPGGWEIRLKAYSYNKA